MKLFHRIKYRIRKLDCNDVSLPTATNIQSIHETLLNSMVSKNIHDQGESLFCWAFAISSMLRQSLKLFISGLDSGSYKIQDALSKLNGNGFHKQLRNELIMLPIPKIKNANISSLDQGHYLPLAIERVSLESPDHSHMRTYLYINYSNAYQIVGISLGNG